MCTLPCPALLLAAKHVSLDFALLLRRPADFSSDTVDGFAVQAYSGFNLVVGDVVSQEVAYLSNRGKHAGQPQMLDKGIYGLSNGSLHDSWPKVETGVQLLQVR